ncbi:hypothetical protein R3P38DRAFT_2599778 [Favolaschia claudopus]|uniref:MYND-type domain-containing protein n=1 Tax=Favolaschia claudopus TaxID=2862362 RepID=A0AAW0E3K5_9AGAR
MHPDLRLSNLDKLPIMKRRLAKSMTTIPLERLALAQFALFIKDTPAIVLNGYLPVFYFLLDPARIPPVDGLDSLAPTTHCDLWSGFISLSGIFCSRPSHQTFKDLWPRVSAWSYYIFHHEDFMCSALGLDSMKQFYFRMMRYLSDMATSAHHTTLILADSNSHVLAARAYSYFTAPRDFLDHRHVLNTIRIVLSNGGVTLDNIFEGIRGDLSDFAHLITRQCEVAVPPSSTEMDVNELCHLAIALSIVGRIDNVGAAREKHETSEHGSGPRHPLCAALVSLGFIRTLTVGALTLSSLEFDELNGVILTQCLCFLQVCLEQDEGTSGLETALRYGLLDVLLVASRRKDSRADLLGNVRNILMAILMPSTVRYHLLGDMEKFLAPSIVGEAEQLSLSTELSSAWGSFASTFRARNQLRKLFDAGELQQCDSLCHNCGFILPKIKFRCCSQCRWALYCSPQCQEFDWRSRHRVLCPQHQRFRAKIRLAYTRKEYQFLLLIVHHEYTETRIETALSLVRHWKEDSDALFTILNYSYFPTQIETITIDYSEDAVRKSFPSSAGAYADKGTRLVVHWKRGVTWVLLLARREGSVVEELKAIAKVGEMSEEEMRERVERVMEEEGMTTVIVESEFES